MRMALRRRFGRGTEAVAFDAAGENLNAKTSSLYDPVSVVSMSSRITYLRTEQFWPVSSPRL